MSHEIDGVRKEEDRLTASLVLFLFMCEVNPASSTHHFKG